VRHADVSITTSTSSHQNQSTNEDIEFQKTYIPIDNCERILADAANPKYKTDSRELWKAYMEEWNYSGASADPAEITNKQLNDATTSPSTESATF
jgi:hypothetical protein